MKKFLRAVRLDASDASLLRATGAAPDGAWVVSGGYAVCDLAAGFRCTPRCHCDDTFLQIDAPARCSIAEVVEIDAAEVPALVDLLAAHLVGHWKAPSAALAREIAEEEIAYTLELCETFAAGVWITVRRVPNSAGGAINEQAIDEQYDVYDRLMIGAHRL